MARPTESSAQYAQCAGPFDLAERRVDDEGLLAGIDAREHNGRRLAVLAAGVFDGHKHAALNHGAALGSDWGGAIATVRTAGARRTGIEAVAACDARCLQGAAMRGGDVDGHGRVPRSGRIRGWVRAPRSAPPASASIGTDGWRRRPRAHVVGQGRCGPEGNGDEDDQEERSGARRMERQMRAVSPPDTRFGRPRDVSLQNAGSRPTRDVPRSDYRARRACVECVARPGHRSGDSLTANRENRPRGASHSPEWGLPAPPTVRTRAARSQSTSRNATSFRHRNRKSTADLPPHTGGDPRAHASATVTSLQVASKCWLPVRDWESRELPGRGSPLDVRLHERQGPTPTAAGLKSDVTSTLSAGGSDYGCGRPDARRKSRVSNWMVTLRPNAFTSTGCTSRTDACTAPDIA